MNWSNALAQEEEGELVGVCVWCVHAMYDTIRYDTVDLRALDVQSGESEEEEVMGEGIGEQEMEELVPE